MKTLDLTENPVTKTPRYRELIIEQIPQLTLLDGEIILKPPKNADDGELNDLEHNENSVSEYTSSLTSSEPSYTWHDPATIEPLCTGLKEDDCVTTTIEYAHKEFMKEIYNRPVSSGKIKPYRFV